MYIVHIVENFLFHLISIILQNLVICGSTMTTVLVNVLRHSGRKLIGLKDILILILQNYAYES